jgi:hypothetical protein
LARTAMMIAITATIKNNLFKKAKNLFIVTPPFVNFTC